MFVALNYQLNDPKMYTVLTINVFILNGGVGIVESSFCLVIKL